MKKPEQLLVAEGVNVFDGLRKNNAIRLFTGLGVFLPRFRFAGSILTLIEN